MNSEAIEFIRPTDLVLAAKTRMPSIDNRRLPALSKRMSESADLPSLYVAAQVALRNCWSLDEVKDVKDKHEAIAVYAKQIKDQTLMYYAERIKLRAVERLGELLAEMPDAKSRSAAAEAAGVTKTLANDARSIVTLSAKTRTAMIEKESPPPSVSSMAWRARKQSGGYSEFKTYAARESRHAPTLQSLAYDLVDYLSTAMVDFTSYEIYSTPQQQVITLGLLAKHVKAADIEVARTRIAALMEFLDELDQRLSVRQINEQG